MYRSSDYSSSATVRRHQVITGLTIHDHRSLLLMPPPIADGNDEVEKAPEADPEEDNLYEAVATPKAKSKTVRQLHPTAIGQPHHTLCPVAIAEAVARI